MSMQKNKAVATLPTADGLYDASFFDVRQQRALMQMADQVRFEHDIADIEEQKSYISTSFTPKSGKSVFFDEVPTGNGFEMTKRFSKLSKFLMAVILILVVVAVAVGVVGATSGGGNNDVSALEGSATVPAPTPTATGESAGGDSTVDVGSESQFVAVRGTSSPTPSPSVKPTVASTTTSNLVGDTGKPTPPPLAMKETDSPTVSPTSVPTSSPTLLIASLEPIDIIESVSPTSAAAIFKGGTPQAAAYDWLTDTLDFSITSTTERLIQRYAMAVFYFSTGGTLDATTSSWSGTNWLDPVDECAWYSTVLGSAKACNDDGILINLAVVNTGLVGKVPPEIGLLENIVELDISGNPGITGGIPGEIGNLASMTILLMADTEVTEPIPDELCALRETGALNLFEADCADMECPAGCCTLCCFYTDEDILTYYRVPLLLTLPRCIHPNPFALGFEGLFPTEDP